MKKKIIIDTDPGVDDAIALMLAIKSTVVDIKAITTVCGNTTIENTTRNAYFIRNLLGASNIPIYSGADKPLKKKLQTAFVHGPSGLDGIDIKDNARLTNSAADMIVNLINHYPKEITIIAIGPLTNIATAIQKDPEIMAKTKELIIMGGALKTPGNTNCVAEFNIFVDPEAADIVFRSPITKTLIPLDICNQISITGSDLKKIKDKTILSLLTKIITPYIRKLSKKEGMNKAILYDPLTMYSALYPNKTKTYTCNISIETKGELTRGMTVTDLRKKQNTKSNVTVVDYINKNEFKKDFFRILNT